MQSETDQGTQGESDVGMQGGTDHGGRKARELQTDMKSELIGIHASTTQHSWINGCTYGQAVEEEQHSMLAAGGWRLRGMRQARQAGR
jgi:hypothetical protein